MYTPKTREEYIACCRYYKGEDYSSLPVQNSILTSNYIK